MTIAILLVGLLTAFGGMLSPTSALAQVGVRPFEDILISGPTLIDLQPHSVTVLVETHIPVVCAVAYGTTTAYGQLATDSDMAGGGHQDHHPVLIGLQPDTEYHFRFGGMGSDGTLYHSTQDYTFRTPKAETPAPQRPSGKNLALLSQGAQVVAVSSNYGGRGNNSTYGANHAIDGDPRTEWSSNGDGSDAWIEIELPSETRVTAIGFWTRTMGRSAQISTFRVVTDRGDTHGPFLLADASGIHYFATDFTARRLRFEVVETSGGNTGAVEIQVYGESAR
ncbi:MAG: discoidin domain-containing protein [Candidatus Bipolaricaulia bacterium]